MTLELAERRASVDPTSRQEGHLTVGDRIAVDLAHAYLGICECAMTTLMVPGGSCAKCQAPERLVIRDPLGSLIEGDAEDLIGPHT